MTESFDKLYGGETKLSDETLNQLENDVAAFELTRATEVDEAHGRPPDLAETEACPARPSTVHAYQAVTRWAKELQSLGVDGMPLGPFRDCPVCAQLPGHEWDGYLRSMSLAGALRFPGQSQQPPESVGVHIYRNGHLRCIVG
ncbi:hypothetical protein FOA52_005500 [Chlamydomonas sp. UWO 241]|nr:hypothetical protein FOA52_005500 [Chlamydomonas sp. UWO 241]